MKGMSARRIAILSLAAAGVSGALAFAFAFSFSSPWRMTTGGGAPVAAAGEPTSEPGRVITAAVDTLKALGNVVGPRTDPADGAPAFDVARISPDGEGVIAGRAAPGATVELLRNGQVHERATADRSGEFVMVPKHPLPPGNYELTLRATEPGGKTASSKNSVAVVLSEGKREEPVVALVAPNKPAVVLSKPKPAAGGAAGALAIDAVEAEGGGKLHVSGRSVAGADVRLYLNDSYIASTTAAKDGRVAFSIQSGVKSGNYRVRLDQVDVSGSVRSRAEVPFDAPASITAPASVAAAASPPPSAAIDVADADGSSQPAAIAASGERTGSVTVPSIETMTVARGDNLWRISRTTYGNGARYSVIYAANRKQISDPDLIYPGQVFVLPRTETR